MKRRLSMSLLVCIFLFVSPWLWGQNSCTIKLDKPGTLWEKLPDNIYESITEIKIIGEINSSDVRTIRELCGGKSNGFEAPNILKKLDISEVRFVVGGIYYIATVEKDQTVKEYLIEDVNKIPDKMFYNCVSVETIVLPPHVTAIGKGAFFNCFDLKNISLPNGITRIETTAFGGCLSLESLQLPNRLQEMGAYMFTHCKELKEITIPDGVKIIRKRSFEQTPRLSVINLPQRLEKIDDEAFLSASGVVRLTLPEGVQETGNNTFQFCDRLEEISFPSSLRRVGKSAFQECGALRKVHFNEGLESIEDWAFAQCPSLEGVNLPSSMITIHKEAFDRCKAMKTLTLGGTQNIGELAFRGCDGLTHLELPSTMRLVDYGAFAECGALKEVIIPNAPIELVQNPFLGCDQMERFVINGNNDHYKVDQGVLYTKDGKKLISFPNKAASEYTILEGTERLEDFAFWFCTNLQKISLPYSFAAFGWRAFCGASQLKCVKVANPTPITCLDKDDPFEGVDYNVCRLEVPKGSEEAYKASEFWQRFKIIVCTALDQPLYSPMKIHISGQEMRVSSLPEESKVCMLYNTLGECVATAKIDCGTALLTLPYHCRGVFLLEIKTEKNNILTQKLFL